MWCWHAALFGSLGNRERTWFAGDKHRGEAGEARCSALCLPYLSRFMLGHCFGACPPPGGTALFCFRFAALRVTVSICDGPSVNAELGTWEAGPLAWLRPV